MLQRLPRPRFFAVHFSTGLYARFLDPTSFTRASSPGLATVRSGAHFSRGPCLRRQVIDLIGIWIMAMRPREREEGRGRGGGGDFKGLCEHRSAPSPLGHLLLPLLLPHRLCFTWIFVLVVYSSDLVKGWGDSQGR